MLFEELFRKVLLHGQNASLQSEAIGVVDGAAKVANAADVAAKGMPKDRLYTGNPATRQKFTWSAGLGPTTIFMKVVCNRVVTEAAQPSVKVTYDQPTDMLANVALAETGAPAGNLLHELIETDDGWVRQDFSAPLTRLDFITAYGTVTEFRVKGV